jgi:predicted NUDIX family phosphoesterase
MISTNCSIEDLTLNRKKGRMTQVETIPETIQAVPTGLFANYNEARQNVLIYGRRAMNLMLAIRKTAVALPKNKETENDARYRQLVCYMLVEHRETRKFVLARREKGQSEERLHNKLYCGIGGHIKISENPGEACRRELSEELFAGHVETLGVFQGLILSYADPVDDVHVGLFFHIQTPNGIFADAERDLHSPEWVTAEELKAREAEMEIWSRVIVNCYLPVE